MPDYVPIQDLEISHDISDTDYVPVSDGYTTFAVTADKFKSYSTDAAEAAAERAEEAAAHLVIDSTLSTSGAAADAKVTGDKIASLDNAADVAFGTELEKTIGVRIGKFETGYAYTTPAIGSTVEKTTAAGYVTALVKVTPGETVVFDVTGGTSNGRAYVFIDQSWKALNRTGNNQSGRVVTTAPNDAVYLAVNNILANQATGYYVYVGEAITDRLDFIEEVTDPIANFKHERDMSFTKEVVFSANTRDFYQMPGQNVGYAVISAEGINYLKLKYASTVLPAVPPVIYFSGVPSTATLIMAEVVSGTGTTVIENHVCTIPANCTHILVQGYFDLGEPSIETNMTYVEYTQQTDKHISDLQAVANKPIAYTVGAVGVIMTSAYGIGSIALGYGKRGPNSLPDITSISAEGRTLYAGGTDAVTMPYTVAAKSNINGDKPTSHIFTGGNHNYNNDGTSDYSATARCVSMVIFADGEIVENGDFGMCNKVRIEYVNRVQAYNTIKADGTGREVIEEKYICEWDGKTLSCISTFTPLEDVTMEIYYGYGMNVLSWPTLLYVGGENRKRFSYADHLDSGNNKPNMIQGSSAYDVFELEVDRMLDLGANPLIPSTASGMFSAGSKAYANLIQNTDIEEDEVYAVRAYYRFYPVG